jgi:multidrug efflux pump subunit AcrA (membrane-fusion protein)
LVLALVIVASAGAYRFVEDRSAGTLTPPVRRGPIVQSVYGIGTVTANRSYQLKPGVTGTLYNLWVKEGDTVARGSRLAQIDAVVYRAPFGGTIVNLPFKVGENVFANFPVLTLVDLLDRYLVVTLEQQGALRVKAGQKATMSFDSIRETRYNGVVQSVYSYGNAFLARIDCSALPASVLPGMTSDVAIEIQEEPDALIVPVAALDRGNLWVKRGHAIPRRIPVKTGIVDKDLAQIVAGDLQPGDQLVLRRALSP